MSLDGYMFSPIGFGAYGQEPTTEIVVTAEDLAPLSQGEMNQFHGFASVLNNMRAFALGVIVGTVTGLAAEKLDGILKLENPVADKIVSTILVPASASIAALVTYSIVS